MRLFIVRALIALASGILVPQDESACDLFEQATFQQFKLTEHDLFNDVSVIDIHGDGDLDIIGCTGNERGRAHGSGLLGQVVVLINDGEGRFSRQSGGELATMTAEYYLSAVGDFDNDGFDDLLVVSADRGRGVGVTSFFRGTSSGLVNASALLPQELREHEWTHVRSVDLDHDGGDEVLFLDRFGWQSWIWVEGGGFHSLQKYVGLLSFLAPAESSGHLPRSIAADVDQDGDVDIVRLVTSQGAQCSVDVLLNKGDGTLARSRPVYREHDMRDINTVKLASTESLGISISRAKYNPEAEARSIVLTWEEPTGLVLLESDLPRILQTEAWSAGSHVTAEGHSAWAIMADSDLILGHLAKNSSEGSAAHLARASECIKGYKWRHGRSSRVITAQLGGDVLASDLVVVSGATIQVIVF